MANISLLADRAAERLSASKDKSDLAFFNITQKVVIGSGITNPSDLRKITGQLRQELRKRSANHRRAEVAKKNTGRAL